MSRESRMNPIRSSVTRAQLVDFVSSSTDRGPTVVREVLEQLLAHCFWNGYSFDDGVLEALAEVDHHLIVALPSRAAK